MADCLASIHLCRVRATRLDQDGFPIGGANNSVVTDKPIQLVVNPDVLAGERKNLVGGCDCLVSTYRGYDKKLGYTLELDYGVMDAAFEELMLGGTAILDAGEPIGVWDPNQVSCTDAPQPNTCFEGWTTAWEDDHPAPSPHRYIHFIWTSAHWEKGSATLQNDFAPPKLAGWTRGNANWGVGIYGDLPEAVPAAGSGWFYADELPTASCGYQTQPLT